MLSPKSPSPIVAQSLSLTDEKLSLSASFYTKTHPTGAYIMDFQTVKLWFLKGWVGGQIRARAEKVSK
jgi:hypothetical protein